MKEVNFGKAPDRKTLLKIKIKQKPVCRNKGYNEAFKHFIRISGPIPELKKICIDQWLGKCCILGRMEILMHIRGQPQSQESFCIFFPLLNLQIVFPALKLTRNCYLNMNISFSWKLSIFYNCQILKKTVNIHYNAKFLRRSWSSSLEKATTSVL